MKETTTAKLLVVTDNSRTSFIEEMLAELRTRPKGARLGYFSDQFGKARTPEERKLLAMLQVAIQRDQLERGEVFGFGTRDIAEYLDLSSFTDNWSSWREAEAHFRSTRPSRRFEPGAGKAFKRIVGITAKTVRAAAHRQAAAWDARMGVGSHRPEEFSELGRRNRRVAADLPGSGA